MSFLESYTREHQKILDDVLGALGCGVFLLDHDLTVVWVNRWLVESASGARPWLGQRLDELVEDAVEGGDPPGLGTLREGGPRKWVLRRPSPRNDARWLEVSVSVLETEGGTLGAIGKVEDISEHLLAEERLREEARNRRMLVEQSRDGIVVVEESGKVYEANQSYADMLGYTLEEVHQLSVWDWDAVYTKEEIRGMIGAVDETGDHFETRHRRKDGTVFDVEISTNGTMCGDRKLIFCVCRDITKRRQIERERLLDELQRAEPELETEAGAGPGADAPPEILSLCAFCKKIRDETGNWDDVEAYLHDQLHRKVSHGICPVCVKEHYAEITRRRRWSSRVSG